MRVLPPSHLSKHRAPPPALPDGSVCGAPPGSVVRAVALVGVLALASTAATGHYTVRSGDTLSSIASRHGVSSRALATANEISDPNRIFAGQTLSVPGTGAGAARTYTIRPGDTLSGIASRHGTTIAALATANGIADRNRIVIGRALSVPPAGSGVPAAPPAPGTAGSGAGLPAALRQSPERLAYVPIFEHWAAHYGVPADLLMAMTWLESGWQRTVVSPTGAVGIGQLMPATTTWMRDIVIREDLDPLRPEDNIRMSARYLQWLLERTDGDVRLALGGYYQGLNAVKSRGLLPTTERYVADILAFRERNF